MPGAPVKTVKTLVDPRHGADELFQFDSYERLVHIESSAWVFSTHHWLVPSVVVLLMMALVACGQGADIPSVGFGVDMTPSAPTTTLTQDAPFESGMGATPAPINTHGAGTSSPPHLSLSPSILPPTAVRPTDDATAATVATGEASVAVSDSDLASVVSGNTAFAVALHRELARSEGNLFYSPYSISMALAMALAGAGGETERQMAQTLGLKLPPARLPPAFRALDQSLAIPTDQTGNNDEFELSIANAVWGQQGHEFRRSYLDTLALNYGSYLRRTDFRGNPGDAAAKINGWVSDATNGQIKDLVLPQTIDSLTRLALTNAVYFKAGWQEPFDEDATARQRFHSLGGEPTLVQMMRQQAKLGYARGDGYQAVELLYVGGEVAMVVLLPDQGTFAEFEQGLQPALLQEVPHKLEERPVVLAVPKFDVESSFDLAGALGSLGMPNAFDATAADFKGMDGSSCAEGDDACLYISTVAHRAFISLDEAGTEAAGATGVVTAITRVQPSPEEPIALTIDRPFIFLIRERATGSILFVGRVAEL